MLPAAKYAYNSAYHRIIKDSPFYLLHMRDPPLPYQILDEVPKPWYNVDQYKEKMALITKRTYERCAAYLEMGREEMERFHKGGKIKNVKLGDRVYLQHIPTKKENKKLQPLYDGPYRVIHQISDVVVKLKNIRNIKEITVHTDRIRVIPEENITLKQNTNVRRA